MHALFAFQLMSKMSQLLGKDMTERLFLSRFCEMCTDPLFHVRKVLLWFILLDDIHCERYIENTDITFQNIEKPSKLKLLHLLMLSYEMGNFVSPVLSLNVVCKALQVKDQPFETIYAEDRLKAI